MAFEHRHTALWPDKGLEPVEHCPVCGSGARQRVYEGLRDRIFFCAPGEWTLFRCDVCGSGYLDPRPTPESIGIAYDSYFTHEASTEFEALSIREKIGRLLANGYRNWRYGTSDYPASLVGVVMAWLFPGIKGVLDGGMRHLPRPLRGQRLLDVGCGNGAFLAKAKSAGWDAVGVDFDPIAVRTGRSRGLDVRLGDVASLKLESEQFDVITLSHVIEHVHDPVKLLRDCHRLLKKQGYVWVETPNMNAFGHCIFGADWRGLEPPRHLILFCLDSLKRALEAAGFTRVEIMPDRPHCGPVFAESEAIAARRNPQQATRPSRRVRRLIKTAEKQTRSSPEVREFLTLKAWKTE